MNADSTFHIGASHAVCQDYSLAGEAGLSSARAEGLDATQRERRPYVILSDGCSSSADTDIGARLLVKAAERMLGELGGSQPCDPARIHLEAARRALRWAKLLGLRPQAVDATLLTVHLDGEDLVVGCSGDGVVCLLTRAGALDVYSISYASNYPLYPAYAHQPARLLALAGAEGGRTGKEVRHFRSASLEERLRPCGAFVRDSPTEVFTVKAADYKYAAIFSDGVHSFFDTGQTEAGGRGVAVPLEQVLRGLISFKSTRGAFVERRMKMFLRDCLHRGWRHADDLSIGALHLGG
ncbi:MAG TPA: protein phosphatase 2C domain-containing protein [Pyrinomonadaceae bacterium]|nr:protein phosphatase 2C domain-containing protein [Pyrinomonadaceae bacterium]